MNTNTENIVEKADEQTDRWKDYARPVARWFHNHTGQLFGRNEAVGKLKEELEISESVAQEAVSNLASDIVDPVVQIPLNGSRYIGIVEFREFDGAYGYVNFDDNRGKEKRVVCAQCVHESNRDFEVTHATSGDPQGTFSENASYNELLDAVHKHYEYHDEIPENVETGATLASGTTIGGNTAIHGANQDSFGIDSFGVGNLTDGDVPQNSGGSLTNTALTYSNISNTPTSTVESISPVREGSYSIPITFSRNISPGSTTTVNKSPAGPDGNGRPVDIRGVKYSTTSSVGAGGTLGDFSVTLKLIGGISSTQFNSYGLSDNTSGNTIEFPNTYYIDQFEFVLDNQNPNTGEDVDFSLDNFKLFVTTPVQHSHTL